ncbi:MAG: hypothetical protein C4326_13470 [Ignavibacteria bacterium]
MNTSSTALLPYAALLRQFNAPPAGKLFCVHGDRSVFRVSLYAAAQVLAQGHPVALVDGANRFDLYYVAEFARRVASRREAVRKQLTPERLLDKIYISRAFTCYQMEATLTEHLPTFVRSHHIPVAMIFGLLDTFYDEQAPLFEAKAGLQRILSSLHSMKRTEISILLAMQDVRPASKERQMLLPMVLSAMDDVYAVVQRDKRLQIVHEGKSSARQTVHCATNASLR